MYERRGAFEHRQWAEAFSHLSAAQRDEQLEAEDLERLAVVADMVGSDRLRSQVEPVDLVPSWAQFRRVLRHFDWQHLASAVGRAWYAVRRVLCRGQ